MSKEKEKEKKQINVLTNDINEKKKKVINKNTVTKEKQTETENIIDNDEKIGNYLNTSNEIERNEDNLKRTIISPNISPDDINLKDNNKIYDDDNYSNSLINIKKE